MATDIHRSIKQEQINDFQARLQSLENGLSEVIRRLDDIVQRCEDGLTAHTTSGENLHGEVMELQKQVDDIHTTVDSITQAE